MHKHAHTIIECQYSWLADVLPTQSFSAAEIVKIQILASINFWNILRVHSDVSKNLRKH